MNRNRFSTLWWLVLAAVVGSSEGLFSADAIAAAPTHPVDAPPHERPAWLEPYRIRFALHVLGTRVKSTAKSIIARVPTGGWVKPDASDIAVQNGAGEQLPVTVLSHDPLGETMIQFPRTGDDVWYWAYAVANEPKPKSGEPFQEGLTAEFRRWKGEDLSDWAAVRTGLEESDSVIGNALVAEVVQNCNPVRPHDPRQFAASYRGYINIEADGVYRFFLNSEDASFLFMDGFKVTERVGTNQRMGGSIPTRSVGADVELKKGVHPFEVHHVMGNNPAAIGYCTMMWVPPGAKTWTYVPRTAFVQADYAQIGGIEEAQQKPAAQFVHGIDDTLRSGEGGLVYLVRLEAVGVLPEDDKSLVWDFGDGTSGTGRSLTHVYFQAGDYQVTLRSGDLPAFRRNVHVWPAPGNTSPLSLGVALRSLANSEWKKFEPQRIHDMFRFLTDCEQPDRWPLVDETAQHLLAQPGLDLKQKVVLYSARMEALAHQGRATEALALGEKILPEFSRVPSLQVGIKLASAQVYHRHLKKVNEASKLYESIVNENRRVEHPNVRIAAIRWGDLFAEIGDLTKAAECYRSAAELGGETFEGATVTSAVTRGGLLRSAEQKLRSGDIRQTRQLLERIELQYPQQKLEGLYRLLRADADRQSGRYEEALRNYEILLKLTQWAGFHDRALYGIADAYYRMGDFAKALEWLETLKKSFPRYYEKQNLAEYHTFVTHRHERVVAAVKGDEKQGLKFADVFSGFEPTEEQDWGKLTPNFKAAPGLGIAGPYVGLGAGFPVYAGYFDLQRPVTNLAGNSEYWVEMWYREVLTSGPFSPHIHMYVFGDGNKLGERGQGTSYFDRTFGQWRKFGFLLKAPLHTEGRVAFSIRQVTGVIEVDGFSVRQISDREADALNNFLKGSDAE